MSDGEYGQPGWDTIARLRQRIDALEDRLQELEQKQEQEGQFFTCKACGSRVKRTGRLGAGCPACGSRTGHPTPMSRLIREGRGHPMVVPLVDDGGQLFEEDQREEGAAPHPGDGAPDAAGRGSAGESHWQDRGPV